MRFLTETGSIYNVDEVKRTWTRESKTSASGLTRSESGPMLWHGPIKVGEHVDIYCPPIVENAVFRLISTSPVVEILGD